MNSAIRDFLSGRRISSVVTASMAAVIIVTVTMITVLDVARQRSIFEDKLQEKGLALSRTLNDVLANSLYFRDMEKLRHLAQVASAQPEILSLTIFAPDGRILVGPGTSKFPSGSVGQAVVESIANSGATEVRLLEAYGEVIKPVVVSNDVIGGIRFRFDRTSLDIEVRETVVQHLWQGALVMLAGIVVSFFLARWIVRPVQELHSATDRISAGEFDFAIEQSRNDEIGGLARALEAMTKRLKEAERHQAAQQSKRLREANDQLREEVNERKRAQLTSEQSSQNLAEALENLRRTQQQLVQRERLSAVGQMSSGIAHDINNRLQVILGQADQLLLDKRLADAGDEPLDRLQMIRESVKDAANVITRDFYQPKQQFDGFMEVDLASVAQSAVSLTEPLWKDQALGRGLVVNVVARLDGLPVIEGSLASLREAVINLIFNAVDALPAGGTVTVHGNHEGEFAVLAVTDDGVGMSEDVRQQCLEPFFTTKGEGGSGLGLAMVYRTVNQHGGSMEIESTPGEGTTVSLRLPARAARAPSKRVVHEFKPADALKVLITDDEPFIRKLLAALLEHDGHRVVTAADGNEGYQAFMKGEFDLVILDRAMPGMNGDELALKLHRLAPEVPIIMLTGFGSLMSASGEQPEGVTRTLSKPVTHDELRAAVTDAVANAQHANRVRKPAS
ncbi:MAG: ATP-binding protein [Pseudomonadota bacterium]